MKKIGLFSFIVLLLCIASLATIYQNQENSNISSGEFMLGITADIYEEDGYIVGEAHNAFTFGFGRIYTIVLLYSSDSFTENIDEMEYECYMEVEDLDFASSMKAKTINEGKYYRCVVRFKSGTKSWVFVESDTAIF